MNPSSTAALTLVEHEILQHVGRALEVSLNWNAAEVSFPRKLQSVRFTAQSFARHLERLLALEEDGGYMEREALKPHWADAMVGLRKQHDVFREQLDRIMPALDRVQAEEASFDQLCDQLRELLGELNSHHARENALLQEMLYDEDGGES